MLSARITALRRAERCRALLHLVRRILFSLPLVLAADFTFLQRLNHAAVGIRWQSIDRNGGRPAAETRPRPPGQPFLDDPVATTIDGAAPLTDDTERRRDGIAEAEAVEQPRKANTVDAVQSHCHTSSKEDAFDKMAEAANEAQRASRKGFRDHLPGIFETIGSKRRGDPFANPQPAQEQGFNMAAAELGSATGSEPRPRDFRNDDYELPLLQLPRDPAHLKALPTGFHDMTDLEQQEELWIVQAEERLGREWELADPGKHSRYSHDYPPYSPSKVIGMLHRWRHRAWTPQQWRLARAIAGNRSLRLPVLTAQAFLRRHALLARRRGVELKIERYLGGTEEWKTRLAELESQTGASEADVKQWLWILSPESGDVKIQRFLKSKCRKPLFLLQLLLAKDKKIHEPATFLGLLQFMRENYVLADRPQDELDHPAYKGQGRSVTWWHYLVFLYRLVWHCREGWPAAMPLLARLTADYIGTMRLDSKARAFTGYQARSLVLNKSLQYFSWPARVRPIDHMEHNWAAQRHLLRLAATTEPPLVMDKNGYRAVRTVLIALGKTKGEAKNADRAAKTWPPYRRTLDGIDERRDPEDDLSRSAKAGMLVRAAGYSDDIVDRALSALGGSTFGQAPTIQTRSLPPAFFSGRLASQNIYSEWAVQVRATRNAREAWMVFENPPEPGIRPTAQIYGEMFEKLYARPATESPAIRAGDAKEVFPVHDGNLSEFEIARLTPPSPEELYDHMLLQDKLRPTGYCLAVLIRNSSSKMMALRYLGDSPYKPFIAALRVPVSKADPASLKALFELPLNIFNAWIAMLCRLHTRAPREQSVTEMSQMSQDGSIPEAIALATAFQAHNAKAAHHDRLPWHTIMQALAGRKILYSRMGAEFNVVETLMTFLRLYERTTASKGIDPVAFEALCLVIRKTLKLTTFEKAEGGRMVPRPYISGTAAIEELLFRAHRYAVETFAALTSPVPTELEEGDDISKGGETEAAGVDVEKVDDGVTQGMLRYNVVGRPVHKYMLALACCGDGRGMVRLMDWLLDGWDREYIREEAKTAHSLDYHYTMRTIAYFAEMGGAGGGGGGGGLVEPGEMDRLRRRLGDMRWEKGCTWFWPEEGWQGEAPVQALPELETDLTNGDSPSVTSASLRDSTDSPVEFEVRRSKSIYVDLPKSTLVQPKSQYDGFIPPLPPTRERNAVLSLMESIQGNEDFVEIELDSFCFYINAAYYPFEMRPLQHMATRVAHDQFFFDGVLSVGGVRHYVQKIEISELPIGNYGTSHATVQGQIWVRSRLNSKKEIYYRLNRPRTEYARFYAPFLWVADLAKHVVDFSAAMIDQGRQVEINSFQVHFIRWLRGIHGKSPEFQLWRQQHPSDDYRTSDCFLPLEAIERIKAGDTISTPRDEETTDTKWRNMASKGAAEDGRWFGLVQKVHIAAKDQSRSFDVTWFYRPVETPCCMMKYPWPNELFLSDHCTCDEGRHSRVKEHEILGVHNIDWFGGPGEGNGEFFVRQTYIIESRRWVTLQRGHMVCSHNRQKLGFRAGDTVLAALSPSQEFAESYEVVKVFRQGDNMFVRLRRLLRRSLVDPQAGAAPNELVYTDQLVVAKPDKVIENCAVRFFRPGESIPTPYDRGGTGNLFYITHRLETQDGEERCVPYDGDFPASLRQGFDPAQQQTFRKLRGMDLFCGSGNFGRGLEEGGAVEMHWANDIWDRAIHTYMANSPDPKSTKPFLGSVDDLLRLALEGKYADNVPRPGDVDFISAGSPCPGFSLLTQDKTTLAQIKNQSLVASFASFVDFYRPKYGILENVSTIVQGRHKRSEDVLCQLFCAIVGMGYQAQLILGDAWSHGAPQCRNRVFLYFAAPGLRLPEAPLLSHSHYPAVTSRGLGEMCNGEPFVRRSFQPTPFKYVSAAEGTSDLPPIGDGKPEPATAFPDHRVCTGITRPLRHQIAAIPTRPFGMSFAKAWRQGNGVLTPADRDLFPADGFRVTPISQGWRRVRPGDVFQTVTTRSQPTDARAGTGLHWVEERPLTVQEIRRAQGFPDREVLLGTVADQWKLVGNSVARQMALALGLRFREAWAGGGGKGGGGGSAGREGSESGSVSVSVGAAEERRVKQQNGHRHSTPREIVDLTTAVKEEPAAKANGYRRSAARDIIDLTSNSDKPNGTHGTPPSIVDLTSASRSATPNGTDRNTDSTKINGGMRKRLLSQSLGPEPEAGRSPKVIRLESGKSTPARHPESPRPANGGPPMSVVMGEPGPAVPPSPAAEEGVTPVRTGPTVVRMWTPEELDSDGLGLDEEPEGRGGLDA
ncbi:hypothetical protein C8A01DRAFT_17585 [Parachaetomium inaequale]|uniref:DNA (cytosine-5-)-methyltransferase n=1 Tax=Parachaetomium inaequale TaxID=2588326 RepID=A0AAN6PFI0_9PEZI|nr:hypothetical protein C8A01DRAFT_17585 [Parachaetomium inaequale]